MTTGWSARTVVATVAVFLLSTICEAAGQELQIGIIDLYGLSRVPGDQVRQEGRDEEDRSEGHALNRDPAVRAIQERFLIYAKDDPAGLRSVLRSSSKATHRALAAHVLGYAADKQAVVEDLVQAMADPSEEVRNDAMRTLLVFADAVPSANRPSPQVPFQPFVALLNSPIWSDRNKASFALLALSANRDSKLFAMLREQALGSLVEMARWHSAGHAVAAFMILGRLAGYSDEAAYALWDRGDREAVINAAIKGRWF